MKKFNYQEVLSFWFAEDQRHKWFAKDKNFDEEITLKFYDQYNDIANEFNYSGKSPEEILAAIIILDQFSRNMFRDVPKAFATDDQALALTKYCIQKSIDQQLSDSYKHFLYMPLMHSENLEDQELSVKLFAFDNSACEYAKMHRDIIKRFGRFPHRNNILGRKSTTEELEFLKQKNSSF
jgi:uncharacterized protein (DUF924 family)